VTSTTASPPPPLDETTTAAIRQALGAAQMGRIADACRTAEHALASGGDRIALNALLGALRIGNDEHEAAIRHLEIAHAGRPADPRIALNLATALAKAGQMDRALAAASPNIALADPSLQLARLRGYLADQLSRFDEAIAAYEHVVRSAPQDWASWNNLGNARLAAGDLERGIADLERAISLEPNSPPARLNLARAYRRVGDFARSEQILRQMADDFPLDAKPLMDLHDLLKQCGREDELLPVLDLAIDREPDNLELLLARASHLGLKLKVDEAEAAFRDALRVDGTNEEAFVGLAVLYEHARPSILAELADEAEQRGVGPNALNLLRAFRERRSKRYAEAVEALNQVAPDFESLRRYDLLGQMLEKLGDYDGAFAAFERMNEIQSQDMSQPLERAASMRAMVREQLAGTTRGWFASWTAGAVEPERRSPVFLVGFPRSGTTLLDTILMGHPNTAVMEERPVISRLKQELGGFDAIAAFDEAAVRDAQRRYFEIAGEYADLASDTLLIDKSPLLLNEAAFIHRLFPSAPFLLAIRHPADVLLSCYFSNFNLNDAMVNFLRLDTAAEYYDLTFDNWENARSIFPLTVHRITYEEMVEDPPAILRPIVEALGLEWHEGMLDHTKTAAERGLISTASYAQVTEPIYKRSVGRWKNYRKHLEPVLPVLAPWAEKFGYTL
jgi:tetratricopeptide (TPR) repeat protein